MTTDKRESPKMLLHVLLDLRSSFEQGTVGSGLYPCLAEAGILAFEKEHEVALPPEYRMFLTLVGNGGAWLFKLGEMDDGWDFGPWAENDGFVGTLANPFQYTSPWNDLTGCPEYELGKENDEEWLNEYDRQNDAFAERYFIPIDGAIPIAHLGCAIRLWLIVTGPERGNVWYDDRANREGIRPLIASDGSRLTFLEWCKSWPNS